MADNTGSRLKFLEIPKNSIREIRKSGGSLGIDCNPGGGNSRYLYYIRIHAVTKIFFVTAAIMFVKRVADPGGDESKPDLTREKNIAAPGSRSGHNMVLIDGSSEHTHYFFCGFPRVLNKN